MTQTIHLSNGHELEFPEGMTDDQIHSAIQKEYGSQNKAQQTPQMVDTAIGKLQNVNSPFGNREFIESLMSGLSGGPGMNVLGAKAPGILQGIGKLLSKGGSNVKNVTQNALKDISPYEQAAQSAGGESEAAVEAAKTAEGLKPGTIAHQGASGPLEQIEDSLGRTLNTGAAHNIRAGQGLVNRVQSVFKYWPERYSELVKKLSDSKFQMPEKELYKLDNPSDIKKLIMQGTSKNFRNFHNISPAEVEETEKMSPYLKDLMSKAPTSKDVNASEYLSKYKDFRNGLYGLRQEAKHTADEGLRRQLFKDIDKAKEMEKTIKDVLENGLGEHLNEFKEINKGYSQVFDLRSNKIVRKLMNKENPGKLSENIAKELSGPGEGQQLLREMAKQDPEIVKNIVGQRYSVKPSEIHAPNEIMSEYLDELPEVKKLLTSKEKTLKDITTRKNVSLKEKIKAEEELSKIKETKKEAQKKLLRVGGAAATSFGGYHLLKNVGHLANLLGGNE